MRIDQATRGVITPLAQRGLLVESQPITGVLPYCAADATSPICSPVVGTVHRNADLPVDRRERKSVVLSPASYLVSEHPILIKSSNFPGNPSERAYLSLRFS